VSALSAWVLLPGALLAASLGCGLLLEGILGRRLPGHLLPPTGFAILTVIAGLFTSRGELASLTTPAVVLAAAAGAALACRGRKDGRSRRRIGVDAWAAAAALGAFLVYLAPVLLSGHPTFTGYIKLDDTATWMAFVDRLMDHGRDLAGLEPSSYRATLEVNLPSGYPVGAFLPLGVGAQLTGTDVAWLVQPYMATMAALLALCLYRISEPMVESKPLRALVSFGAAQSAILFAYGLWGGVKEVAAALAVALLAALAAEAARKGAGWRETVAAAIAVAALLTMVGAGGLVWIAPILLLAGLGLWRNEGLRALIARALPLLLVAGVLAVPALFAAGVFSPTQGGLTSDAELGNLLGPLNAFQYAGIWPSGDFRLDPANGPLTAFLILLASIAAACGVVLGWRRRAWLPLGYFAAVSLGSLAVFAYSSPWVGGKALASGSPAFLLLALSGAAALATRIERTLGATVLGLVLAGVLWSNFLAYHDANLAPFEQLRELESIGQEFAGEGPTLMTEYNPYGVRHFLRDADAEGASELRTRPVPLEAGGELEKGDWGDTDAISLSALLGYRTLVLRRSPAQSRPPSVYSLVRRGEFYDVWQQRGRGEIITRLPLGSFEDPGAIPSCREVLRAARLAGPGAELVAAERGATVVASLGAAVRPEAPTEAGSPDVVPHGAGAAGVEVSVSRHGRYGFYLQGSVRNRMTLLVDGREIGSVAKQLNAAKQFLYFGASALDKGAHEAVLVYEGQTLGPGSGGPPEPVGPLVLSPARNEDPTLRRATTAQAAKLCGKRLDWVEAVRWPA